jgi:DNA-binding transcriptional LysR family regulator
MIILFTNMNNLSLLPELAVFVAVAESGGFSLAARRLGVSKAKVTMAIQRLEVALGVRLFQRTTRHVSLSGEGTDALPHAQRALSAAQDAIEAATLAQSEERGLLRISAPMSFGLLHVAPAIGAFSSSHPQLTIELNLDDRMLDLIGGGFDLALRIGTLPDSTLTARRISTHRSVLVAHSGYLAKAGTPKVPGELAAHAALLYSLVSAEWRLSKKRARVVHKPRAVLSTNSSLVLKEALLQGLGIARMPLFVVGPDLAAGRLVHVLPDWTLPEAPIQVVSTGRVLTKKARAFVEFLRARIGEPPSWERDLS